MAIILLAVLGMIISMVVGMLWYSLKTPMGKLQQAATGMGDMQPQNMWKYFVAQGILALLTSVFIAFIMIEQKGLGTPVIFGEVGFLWLCFVVPVIGQNLLWGNTDKRLRWKKFFSDTLSNLVTYIVIILAFSLFVH